MKNINVDKDLISKKVWALIEELNNEYNTEAVIYEMLSICMYLAYSIKQQTGMSFNLFIDHLKKDAKHDYEKFLRLERMGERLSCFMKKK